MRSAASIIHELLAKRGVRDEDRFLNPDWARDTYDPFLMKGMDAAVDRLAAALKGQEKIGIFGDYDADGVPGTAILVRVLTNLGAQLEPVIPTRFAGYGLNEAVVADMVQRNVTLLIAVDNGTVAGPEINSLRQRGIETIVCDHHEPEAGHLATEALAILNPKQLDCPYPFKELCGAAIAWKLLQALYQRMGKPEGDLKWELDLVGLATIADMVPLTGENRVLAWYGLKVMRKSRNLGLQALAKVAGTDLGTISSGSVGFRLAPRINAPSRMHQETQEGFNVALRLLTTEDQEEAANLAAYLNVQNLERQSLLEQHLREAIALAEGALEDLCLVVYQPEWSTGVIGLLAGRLMDKYGRPAIALASESGQIKGSVRSVDGIHAVEMLAAASPLIEKYGGHSKAAGFSLLPSESKIVDAFRDSIASWMRQQKLSLLDLEAASRRLVDLKLNLEEVTLDLANALESLQPFGVGFKEPVFQVECTLCSVRLVGAEGKHLACLLDDGKVRRKGIAFGMGSLAVQEGGHYLVDFAVEAEVWQSTRSASCRIQRIVPVSS